MEDPPELKDEQPTRSNLSRRTSNLVLSRRTSNIVTECHQELFAQFWQFLDPEQTGTALASALEAASLRLKVPVPAAHITAVYEGHTEHDVASFGRRVLELKLPSIWHLLSAGRRVADIFAVFDRLGCGTITADDLGRGLSKMTSWRPTRYELQKLVAAVSSEPPPSSIPAPCCKIALKEFADLLLGPHDVLARSEACKEIRTRLADLYRVFQTFDVDSSTAVPDFCIDISTFTAVMCALGDTIDQQELQELFDEIDADGGGTLDFTEFVDSWCGPHTRCQRLMKSRMKELKLLFDLFDQDGGGILDSEELAHIMRRLGRKPSEEELSEALGARAGDGGVVELDLTGFVQLVCGSSSRAQEMLHSQLLEFRECFELFDHDFSGGVSVDEFVTTFAMLGHLDIDPDEMTAQLAGYGNHENGEISYVEFIAMIVDDNDYVQQNIKTHLVAFREAFNLFDTSGQGNVTLKEFQEAWNTYGFQAGADEVKATLEAANTDDDDGVCFHEFVHMISGGHASVCNQMQSQLSEMRELFSLLDPNGDGGVSPNEIWRAFVNVAGVDVTEKQIIELRNNDESSELDFSDFARMMAPSATTVQVVEPVVQCDIARLKMLLSIKPAMRSPELCEEIKSLVCAAGFEQLLFGLQKLEPAVMNEVCRHIQYHEHKPFKSVCKQGLTVHAYTMVLTGTVLCWRASTGGPPSTIWSVVQHMMDKLLLCLRKVSIEIPNKRELSTKSTHTLLELLERCWQDGSKWTVAARDLVRDDLTDARDHEECYEDGKKVLQLLHQLLLTSDDLRKQQMLLKFFLQLQTLSRCNLVQVKKPINNQKAANHHHTLVASNAAFILVTPPATAEDSPVIAYVSETFLKLTHFERSECVGHSWSILQGRETDPARWSSLSLCLACGEPRLELMKVSKHNSHAPIAANVYAAPYPAQVTPDGQASSVPCAGYGADVLPYPAQVTSDGQASGVPCAGYGAECKWVLVFEDASPVLQYHDAKPVVEHVVLCCKKLLKAVKETLGVLGPAFEVAGWELTKASRAHEEGLLKAAMESGNLHNSQLSAELQPKQAAGNTIFASTPEDSKVTMLAGPDGAIVLSLAHLHWTVAHSLEPIAQLQKLPSLRTMSKDKLDRLACSMSTQRLCFREKVLVAGEPSTHIVFVKDGELALQFSGSPLQVELGGADDRLFVKRKSAQVATVAILGPGDVYDDPIERVGQLINKWTLVAMSHSTVVYKMPRTALKAAVDQHASLKTTVVENKRVASLRRRHRDKWCHQRKSALDTQSALESPSQQQSGDWMPAWGPIPKNYSSLNIDQPSAFSPPARHHHSNGAAHTPVKYARPQSAKSTRGRSESEAQRMDLRRFSCSKSNATSQQSSPGPRGILSNKMPSSWCAAGKKIEYHPVRRVSRPTCSPGTGWGRPALKRTIVRIK